MTDRSAAPIVLDIDGTLYDSTALLLDAVARRYGIVLAPEKYTEWNSWAVDLSPQQISDLIDEDFHAPEAILAAVPYEGAAAVVRAWQAAGHPIHIVSHRAPHKEGPTKAWLAGIGLEPDVFVIARRLDKIAYAREHGAVLLVDDKPAIIADAAVSGVAIATIIQPYNAALVASLGAAVIAASDWPALGAAIRAAGILEQPDLYVSPRLTRGQATMTIPKIPKGVGRDQ